METPADLGHFENEPNFPFLWDQCVYKLLYNPKDFVEEFCSLLSRYGITKKSKILDTCTGSGFPALDMFAKGYKNVVCVDGSDEQVEFFNQKASAQHLGIRSERALFNALETHFSLEFFDALICKATIWYAEGGWNMDFQPNKDRVLATLKQTLSTFYGLLKKGGVLYVDKFKDTEVNHRDLVGTFTVGDQKKELYFWAERDRQEKIRRAKMITRDVATGEETGLPNVTYDLSEKELEAALVEVGFKITQPAFNAEKFFTNWFAVKE